MNASYFNTVLRSAGYNGNIRTIAKQINKELPWDNIWVGEVCKSYPFELREIKRYFVITIEFTYRGDFRDISFEDVRQITLDEYILYAWELYPDFRNTYLKLHKAILCTR